MNRSEFETRAHQLVAYAKELQVTTEDCVAHATNCVAHESTSGLAGTAPDEARASVALGRVCDRIEDMMAAYDRLQEIVGSAPRYKDVLNELGATPEPGASFPAPSD